MTTQAQEQPANGRGSETDYDRLYADLAKELGGEDALAPMPESGQRFNLTGLGGGRNNEYSAILGRLSEVNVTDLMAFVARNLPEKDSTRVCMNHLIQLGSKIHGAAVAQRERRQRAITREAAKWRDEIGSSEVLNAVEHLVSHWERAVLTQTIIEAKRKRFGLDSIAADRPRYHTALAKQAKLLEDVTLLQNPNAARYFDARVRLLEVYREGQLLRAEGLPDVDYSGLVEALERGNATVGMVTSSAHRIYLEGLMLGVTRAGESVRLEHDEKIWGAAAMMAMSRRRGGSGDHQGGGDYQGGQGGE